MNLVTISNSSLIRIDMFKPHGFELKKKIAIETVKQTIDYELIHFLNQADVIIFQSKNAVRHLSLEFIPKKGMVFYTVGPFTGEILESRFNVKSTYPKTSYSSQTLYDECKLMNIGNKNIGIIKGLDGIDLLEDNLKENNNVKVLNTYKRQPIKNFISESDMSLKVPNVFISLSNTALDALMSQTLKFKKNYRIFVIVPSTRLVKKSPRNSVEKYFIWDQVNEIHGLINILKEIK